MNSVGKLQWTWYEVRRQFKEIPGLWKEPGNQNMQMWPNFN
jgi:hypothetical protein